MLFRSVKVGAEVKAAKVVVHYRGLGAKAWLTAPLAKTKGLLWKAEIPAAATVADSIQYYVDSTNAKGKRVAARGSQAAPYVVAVLKTAKPTAIDKKLDNENPLLDVEENPLDQAKKKPKK